MEIMKNWIVLFLIVFKIPNTNLNLLKCNWKMMVVIGSGCELEMMKISDCWVVNGKS